MKWTIPIIFLLLFPTVFAQDLSELLDPTNEQGQLKESTLIIYGVIGLLGYSIIKERESLKKVDIMLKSERRKLPKVDEYYVRR